MFPRLKSSAFPTCTKNKRNSSESSKPTVRRTVIFFQRSPSPTSVHKTRSSSCAARKASPGSSTFPTKAPLGRGNTMASSREKTNPSLPHSAHREGSVEYLNFRFQFTALFRRIYPQRPDKPNRRAPHLQWEPAKKARVAGSPSPRQKARDPCCERG